MIRTQADLGQAQKYGLVTEYSNYDNVSTYNKDGYSDYSHLIEAYDEAYDIADNKAGEILKNNLQDQTAKSGLALAGWNPKFNDMEAQAVDWWSWGKFRVCQIYLLPKDLTCANQTLRLLIPLRRARLSLALQAPT